MTTESKTDAPPLDRFDLTNLREPDDGIVYLYRSSVDGFWHIDADEDMALQEATGHPVGELIEYEEMGDYDDAEYGELHALYIGDPQEANNMNQSDTDAGDIDREELFKRIMPHRDVLRDVHQMQDNLDELERIVKKAEWLALGGRGCVDPERVDRLCAGVEDSMPYLRDEILELPRSVDSDTDQP